MPTEGHIRPTRHIPQEKITNSRLWLPHLRDNIANYQVTDELPDRAYQAGITKIITSNEHVTPIITKHRIEINSTNTRTRQIQLYPTEAQKKIILSWMEVYRVIYNYALRCIKYMTRLKPDGTRKKLSGWMTLRDKIKYRLRRNRLLNEFVSKSRCPQHIQDEAVHDVHRAYVSAFANLRNRNITHFRIRPKKPNKANILTLDQNNFSRKGGICVKVLGRTMKASKPLTEVKTTSILIYSRLNNRFILHVPYEKEVRTSIRRWNKCSLDPGVRAFQTTYSPDGICYEIKPPQSLYNLDHRIQNVKTENPAHKKFLIRLRKRMRNIVTDLHWKVARYLCKHFDNILLGKLSTKDVVKRGHSVLGPKSKRMLYALSHFTFSQRLQSKAEEFGVDFSYVNESYTTKTCGNCAYIKNDVGSAKVFICNSCGYHINRDMNGARNILIKHS